MPLLPSTDRRETAPHQETNKVPVKSIIVDQIQDLQRTFGDNLQNSNKVCRDDK